MNLVCFPHYTCGGLLVDIFQRTFSSVASYGGINSLHHNIGKIGDADTVFDNYDPVDFMLRLEQLGIDRDIWAGTHCWPGILPDTNQINQLILVTTTTSRSKLYRWIRAYYHHYEKSEPWLAVAGTERIDKERETAKNYIQPFLPVARTNIINIEFAEIVENTKQFQHLVAGYDAEKHIERWQEVNSFLYADNLWNSAPVRRFYEAELEVNLNQNYIYE